mmetsp:Transcript_61838/g.69220  ORF Transcript_61838/g.69220 Transcript_61838/m.69220 type:complete len:121 (-) Transcript_61838:51-413(-)
MIRLVPMILSKASKEAASQDVILNCLKVMSMSSSVSPFSATRTPSTRTRTTRHTTTTTGSPTHGSRNSTTSTMTLWEVATRTMNHRYYYCRSQCSHRSRYLRQQQQQRHHHHDTNDDDDD